MEKLKALLTSVRFWVVTLAAASGVLSLVADGASTSQIFDAVTIYLGTVAGIGTLDSVAEKVGKSKK